MRSWDRFFGQFQKDLKLWLFFVVFLGLFRVFLIFTLKEKIEAASGIMDILRVCLLGFRFDGMAATYFILIPFLMSVACGFFDIERAANKVRGVFAGIFVVATTILCGVDYGFFREFDEQINPLVFQFFQDDTKALISTIWQDYHPIINFSAMGVFIALGIVGTNRLIRFRFISEKKSSRLFTTTAKKIAVTLCIVAFMIISARGTLQSIPLDRRILLATQDEFLNKTILSVHGALRYAVMDFINMTHADKGLETYLPDRDVVKAARYVFSTSEQYQNLDDYYKKQAAGPISTPPRHIFLIIGESYDSWPLLEKYRSLGLMENLKYFIRQGISIENFLPASDLTMFSLGVLLTGLPDSGIIINQHISSLKPYPGALAETFNRLGWRTRFFYGGYPTWQRVTDFARSQGFRETYDATSMAASKTKNPWGVDDSELFDLVIKTVNDDAPSLNVILTTNNHTPYSTDVWGKGFPIHAVPKDIKPLWDNAISLKMIGHQWYTDKCIGDFVKTMEHRIRLPLFAITGDHYGRKYINKNSAPFEKSAVPFVLYGKEVVDSIPRTVHRAGSHLDIPPTLIEMVAPQGFVYHAMGENLLSPEGRSVGIGRYRIITADCLIDLGTKPPRGYPLRDGDGACTLSGMADLKKLHDALHGIAWWRVKYGAEVSSNKNKDSK